MSIIIYTSEKSLPYVYVGIHKETKHFYFGYRKQNTNKNIPSSEDLGKTYFTSSKNVKDKFFEFDWFILAEFFDWQSAYELEQQLICDNLKNELCLNKRGYKNYSLYFSMSREKTFRRI